MPVCVYMGQLSCVFCWTTRAAFVPMARPVIGGGEGVTGRDGLFEPSRLKFGVHRFEAHGSGWERFGNAQAAACVSWRGALACTVVAMTHAPKIGRPTRVASGGYAHYM